MEAGGGTTVSVTVQQSSVDEAKPPAADLGPVVAEPALQSLTIGRVKAPGNRPSRDFRKSMIPLEDPPEEDDGEEEEAKEKDATVKTSPAPNTDPQRPDNSQSFLQELGRAQTHCSQGNNCIENQNLDVKINPNQSKPISKDKDPKLNESQDKTTEASEQADDQQSPSSLYNNMVEIDLDETVGQNGKVEGNTPKNIASVNNPPAQNLVSSQVSRSQEKCLPISRQLSKIPCLTKFFWMEVNIGVSYFNIALIFLWLTYFLGALFGKSDDDGNGNWLWGLVWCLINVASSYSVFYGMKHSRRIYIIPALFLSVLNFVAGGINILINFIVLNPFAGVWLLMLTTLNIYYAVALKTVFDSMPCALPPWLLWLQPVSTEEWVEDEEQGLSLMEDDNLGFAVDDKNTIGSV